MARKKKDEAVEVTKKKVQVKKVKEDIVSDEVKEKIFKEPARKAVRMLDLNALGEIRRHIP